MALQYPKLLTIGDVPNFNGSNASIDGNNWMTSLSTHHGFNTIYALESPPFNMEGGSGSYTLTFDYRLVSAGSSPSAPNASGFNVESSIDGGDSWTVLGSSSDVNWFTDASIAGLNGEPGFWKQAYTIYQPSYQPNVSTSEVVNVTP